MNILRTAAERISREKILKRRILVNEKRFPIFVSPDAQLKYLKPGHGAFDQDLIDIAEQYLQPTSNVWDIGANVGVFTFAAAAVATEGNIVSVEADIWLAKILRKSVACKEYENSNICVLPVAISNKNSIDAFLIAARGRASNAIATAGGRSQMGGIREKQYVPTLTLDTLLETFPRPDFIKIDVEGAELMVIEGAERIINEVRPTFYIEVGGEMLQEILQGFSQAKYSVLDHQGNPTSANGNFNNLFFVPQETCLQEKLHSVK